MDTGGFEGYLSREDRIVAEFGDGLDVAGIALRYGLTVAQVYAVIERQVGPGDQGLPSTSPAPAVLVSPGFGTEGHGFAYADAIVAEYGAGNDVEWIARKYGISVELVYEVVQREVDDDPRPPAGPTSSW